MRKILSALRSLANSIVSALRRHFTPLLLSSGIAILGYVAFQYGAMFFEQRRLEARWLEQQRILQPDDSRSRIALSSTELTRISIPSIQFAAVIVEGTDESSLLIGPGHLAGTAEPGEPGNAVVSGHRDTFFRPLRNIPQNDMVTVTTPTGEFRYRVVSTRIVRPDNVAVLNATENQVLTLVTCYPFYFVGPAPSRFIVRAARVDTPLPERPSDPQ